MTKKTIHIHYYAVLREQRGVDRETVETEASDAGTLYADLGGRHRFSMSPEKLRLAVNDEFRPWETLLNDGDTVVFIPPVAGG